MKSLEHSEQLDAEAAVGAMQLFKPAVVIGPNIVHHEVFRAASQSFDAVRAGLAADVPLWFKSLLKLSNDGVWDSFA